MEQPAQRKSSGNPLTGLCPFHSEVNKSPLPYLSATIHPHSISTRDLLPTLQTGASAFQPLIRTNPPLKFHYSGTFKATHFPWNHPWTFPDTPQKMGQAILEGHFPRNTPRIFCNLTYSFACWEIGVVQTFWRMNVLEKSLPFCREKRSS